MRESLLSRACCPACEGALEIQDADEDGGEILEGSLRCLECSTLYQIHKGIPYLMTPEMKAAKLREMEGWVAIWRQKGMYDEPEEHLMNSFKFPYVAGVEVTRLFEIALQEMDLKGDEVILDLGAGQGWASCYFAERGCEVVAADVVIDDWFGLGRSWDIMEHAGVYFHPVLADGENLPLRPCQFDIVFFFGALHHFERFGQVLAESYRVLKPGGRLIASSEPSIAVVARERTIQETIEETHVGITERRPKTFEYQLALVRAGFKNVRCDVFETYDRSSSEIHTWVASVWHNARRAIRVCYRPVAWLVPLLLRPLPAKLAAWLTLCASGGNLFLRGIK